MVEDETSGSSRYLTAQVQALATVPEAGRALAARDGTALRSLALPYADAVRRGAGFATLRFAFIAADGTVILKSGGSVGIGCDISGEAMFDAVAADRSSVTGMRILNSEAELRASSPVISGNSFAGVVCIGISLSELLSQIGLPADAGLSLMVPNLPVDPTTASEGKGGNETTASVMDGDTQSLSGEYRVLQHIGRADTVTLRQGLTEGGVVPVAGKRAYGIVPLKDFKGAEIGRIVVNVDGADLWRAKRDKLLQLTWLFSAGALLLLAVLYFNVVRIEKFLHRLKKIIIAFHSSEFNERFESDHVHCLEVLQCRNEECPVYKNPSLVCYLETGSEAISPEWRDTCIFLNKYGSCDRCPVYELRRGDELAEMRNVVNTMMRLWSDFLQKAGHLMAYVLQAQERTGRLPSLDEVSDRLGQMAKLSFFSHDLQGVLDKEEVYNQLAQVFRHTFHIHRFVLFEVDHDADRIVIALDNTENEPLCKKQLLLSTEVCRAKRVAEDVVSFFNPVLCPCFNCDTDNEVRVCLPMTMGGQVGAVFSCVVPRRDWAKVREIIPVLRKYLNEAAPVLSSLRLLRLTKEQALRDPLTKCHNRRFLDEYITKYEPLSDRRGGTTAFLMADLDYFKQVNDRYGHEAGDAVLRQVVGIIQSLIRRSDLLIRYGGEEFLILLQDVKDGAAMTVAEKIRLAVESHQFDVNGNGARISKTISIGVSEYPSDADALYKCIKFADVALYKAKDAGRNRVLRFKSEMWSEEQY